MSNRQVALLAATGAWLTVGIVVGAPLVWLALGAVLVAVAAASPHAEEHADREHTLRRQLAVARRRGEPVDVVCASALGVDPAEVHGALRISDFVTVHECRDGAVELQGVVDSSGLDRAGFESRVRDALGGRWAFAWARFPEDGATFDALVERARSTAATSLSTSDPGGN